MPESQERWLQRHAIELLAQHIPFETNFGVKAECIEELRALVLQAGQHIDRAQFGFEARQELRRLHLWHYFDDSTPLGADEGIAYGHGHMMIEEDDANER